MIRMLKIIVWKNVRTNNWECVIRDRVGKLEWKLAPAFKTKEEAIAYASSMLQIAGFAWEVIEL